MKEVRQFRLLIGVALFLLAGILFYNLFFTPGVTFVKANGPVDGASALEAEPSAETSMEGAVFLSAFFP